VKEFFQASQECNFSVIHGRFVRLGQKEGPKRRDLKRIVLANNASGHEINSHDSEPVFVYLNTVHILIALAIAVKKVNGRYLIMAIQALPNQRFIRKTELSPNEYRKRFRQIDEEVIAAVTSPEADEVTPLMSKIYLRLANAPDNYWEQPGVLRFEAEIREGKRIKAWTVLCQTLRVSSATASKALTWMHKEGIIGYFSGKNGVGLRVFLNRATSSIGLRPVPARKKNFDFSPGSSGEARASRNETTFKETYSNLENLDIDINSRAPENGAAKPEACEKLTESESASPEIRVAPTDSPSRNFAQNHSSNPISNASIVEQIKREVVAHIRSATAQEHERTREWFVTHAMPKAIRVAQRSAYDVLRSYGLLKDSRSTAPHRGQAHNREVGKQIPTVRTPRLLTDKEITELAESCVALLITQGQTLDLTLSEMSVKAGGFLLSEDAPKVRSKAESLTLARGISQCLGRESNGH
jgi:hypothetical protein